MTYRIFTGIALCLLTGCTAIKPLPFTSAAQRFGYGNEAILPLEPFAGLAPARPNGSSPAPTSIPIPASPDRSGPPAPDVQADVVPTGLPIYDETKDPNVTVVLLPEVTKADLDGTYRRGPNGKIELPPPAQLPIIETESVRAALLSADN